MNILIAGGTGFIGQALCHLFLAKNYSVTVVSRQSSTYVQSRCGRSIKAVQNISALPDDSSFDVIINLTGAGIADKRWSDARKQVLELSRYETTQSLVNLITRLEHKPDVFISGSAVGYYGDQKDEIVTEASPPHDEYTHQLCARWETIAQLAGPQTRVCLLRTGLVMGPTGGFLSRLWLPFKLGLGGRLGSGEQYMPWVHLEDMLGIIEFLINSELSGPVNACAPEPVKNKDFTRILAAELKRPAFMHAPAWVLKKLLGEMSVLLLTGQRAVPQKLLDAGYEFGFTSLQAALADISNQKD